jgi:ferritin heavy chain
MTDFLEGNFLNEQVDSIKQLGGFVTQLKRLGPGLGEHMFDKELGESK